MARPSVLVVDDTPTNLVLLERILRRGGYEDVATTDNPHQALALFEESPFNVVMVDLHMPGLDGLEVISRLRARSGGAETCIVLVTGDGPEVSGPARAAGASAVLEKPFTPADVLALLDGCLASEEA